MTSIIPNNLKFITATVTVHFLPAYKFFPDLERCRWKQQTKLTTIRRRRR
jgi:hypothetical protein